MLLRQILSLVITLIRKVKSIKHIKHLVISNMKAGLFVQYRKHFQINTKYKLKELFAISAPSPQKRSSIAVVNCWININCISVHKQSNRKPAAHNKGMLRLNQFHVKYGTAASSSASHF